VPERDREQLLEQLLRHVMSHEAAPLRGACVDGETLARLGKSDIELLAPITHRSKEAQEHLAVQRARIMAVSTPRLRYVG